MAKSIFIIGAGVAGLTAGKILHEAGYFVTIFEGRDRIGGRVWTDRSMNGIPLDMGASWIHGVKGNPITKLAKKLKFARIVTDYDNAAIYDGNGDEIEDDHLGMLFQIFERLIDDADDIADDSPQDLSLRDVFDSLLVEYQIEAGSEAALILEYGLNTYIEHEFAASVELLSAKNWNIDDEFGGDDVLFPDGYDWLITHLAEGLTVHLNHTVTEINYEAEGVNITTNHGNFTADAAIITVPLGVLKKNAIQFHPTLPDEKQQAINGLNMGTLNKLYLQFEDVFWDEDVDLIGYVDSEAKGRWGETYNFAHVVNQPVLLCFNGGEFAIESEALSDEELVASAMEVLRKIYGDHIPDPINYLRTNWTQDPFSYGSYSSHGIGTDRQTRADLAVPIDDVLFFAGEATHQQFPSTVHGAYLSGQRAAKEIIKLK